MVEALVIVLLLGAVLGLVLFVRHARVESKNLRAEIEDLERLRGPRVRPIGEPPPAQDGPDSSRE